ncbi:hypothetical protein [Streptomyces axinellae]|uniref:hypothetical protein n=1 Tax=Streptomyces axinellae TaxID=552788 RepID=UPI0031D91347
MAGERPAGVKGGGERLAVLLGESAQTLHAGGGGGEGEFTLETVNPACRTPARTRAR